MSDFKHSFILEPNRTPPQQSNSFHTFFPSLNVNPVVLCLWLFILYLFNITGMLSVLCGRLTKSEGQERAWITTAAHRVVSFSVALLNEWQSLGSEFTSKWSLENAVLFLFNRFTSQLASFEGIFFIPKKKKKRLDYPNHICFLGTILQQQAEPPPSDFRASCLLSLCNYTLIHLKRLTHTTQHNHHPLSLLVAFSLSSVI